MVAFTITDSAMEQIQRALSRADIVSLIVNLIYMSPPVPTYPEMLRAIEAGKSEEALRTLALSLYRQDLQGKDYKLIPGIYRRDAVPDDCCVEVAGVWFSFIPQLQLTIDGGVLDTSGDALVLKSKDGSILMPPFTSPPYVDA